MAAKTAVLFSTCLFTFTIFFTLEALVKLFAQRANPAIRSENPAQRDYKLYCIIHNMQQFACGVGSSRHGATEGEDVRTEIR